MFLGKKGTGKLIDDKKFVGPGRGLNWGCRDWQTYVLTITPRVLEVLEWQQTGVFMCDLAHGVHVTTIEVYPCAGCTQK